MCCLLTRHHHQVRSRKVCVQALQQQQPRGGIHCQHTLRRGHLRAAQRRGSNANFRGGSDCGTRQSGQGNRRLFWGRNTYLLTSFAGTVDPKALNKSSCNDCSSFSIIKGSSTSHQLDGSTMANNLIVLLGVSEHKTFSDDSIG